ncbi:hypothetical protein PU634_10605 [Oceanimonas pelagia]|uniref:Uncharacterized protein n=1 Tax=Oceanimonas pelagia TaxID=3028314 RepID=A0AA50KM54_9GAMM|nr:hypothetical protein [Oceanimonas pelagia]WMC09567.1 hypothetical protein PU634_10605 [Oceanimonas pelagia]
MNPSPVAIATLRWMFLIGDILVFAMIVVGHIHEIPSLVELGVGFVWSAVITFGGLNGILIILIMTLDLLGYPYVLDEPHEPTRFTHWGCAHVVLWAVLMVEVQEITLAGLVLLTYASQFMLDKTILRD